MSEALNRYQLWLSAEGFDAATKAELKAIEGQTAEIEDRFYQDLQFGTAGLRGILGAGTNRMNFYTVARAAEGFARYYESRGADFCKRGLAISYDSRHFSREFAELTARVFIGHGIDVYFSSRLRPVPYLSFMIRKYGCAGGAMITASHNPKKYNGFKAYGEDGGQFPPEAAAIVAANMAKVTDLPAVLAAAPSFAEIEKSPQFHLVDRDLDEAYANYAASLAINPEAVLRHKDLEIVYTPLHGSGLHPVTDVLKKIGLENVKVVPEQAEPDGDFTTCPYPNPEMREALEMGIQLAEKEHADLLIATDPDADRTGLAVRTKEGDFIVLTGNQIGILLMDYILSAKEKRGTLGDKSFCVTTVVSSRLPKRIAAHYKVDLALTLTGFKYIAEQIQKRQDEGDETFQFGYEESFGYLYGHNVRDKDAVITSMLIAEMACVAADEGQTLYDRLQDLYKRFGFGAEKTVSLQREGKVGLEKIAACMKELRAEYKTVFADQPVSAISDFQTRQRVELASGKTEALEQEQSNVLIFELDDLDWFAIRPSGTEPKLKIYFGVYHNDRAEAEKLLEARVKAVVERVEALLDR